MKKNKSLLSLLLSLSLVCPFFSSLSYADTADLKILATTDIHTAYKDYNYYTDKEDAKSGLVRVASIIKEQRKEAGEKNTLLFDNGDFIQGTPLGDYLARIKGLKKGEKYVGVEILNYLHYDAVALGNHEFNYGLEYLDNVMQTANYPHLSANTYKYGTNEHYVKPYVLLDKQILTDTGDFKDITIGVIGVVPPQILVWDSAHLDKKLDVKDIVESVKKYVPKMKQEGADIIVALSHSGMGSENPNTNENVAYQISQIDGIDVVISGHSHLAFPSDKYKGMKNVDIEKGLVNGKPFNISGAYADALGVIDLKISDDTGKWVIEEAKSKNIPVFNKEENKSVEPDKEVEKILEDTHKGTLEYIRSAIGETKSPITSFFALAQDDSSIQLVNNAQKWYAQQVLKGTEYEKLPILSAAAPFKAGGRMGPQYYTNIEKGTLAIKNMADLYIYPNTLYVLKINGAELKNWLERSAGQFNQIDPSKEGEQMLVNNEFPTYNFDVIDGVEYKIDITQPSKYDRNGKLINKDANRIVDLTYDGKPVEDDQVFAIATNNYRAGGGGNFPNINLEKSIYAAPDENRQIIVNYISQTKEIDPKADGNWTFAPIKDNKSTIILQSSPNAKDMAGEDFEFVNVDEKTGYANYKLNLK